MNGNHVHTNASATGPLSNKIMTCRECRRQRTVRISGRFEKNSKYNKRLTSRQDKIRQGIKRPQPAEQEVIEFLFDTTKIEEERRKELAEVDHYGFGEEGINSVSQWILFSPKAVFNQPR